MVPSNPACSMLIGVDSFSLTRYDLVALDFDGTLTDFVAADRVALAEVHREHATDVPFDTFVADSIEVIMAVHDDVDAGRVDGLRLHDERLERLLTRLGAPSIGAAERYRAALRVASAPVDGASELLAGLAASGRRVAVVSNAYDADEQRARVAHAFPGVAFDAVVIASECRAPTPDRAPFDRLLDPVGPVERAVSIGDIPRYDVPGARAAGFDVVIATDRPDRAAEARVLGAAVVPAISALRP